MIKRISILACLFFITSIYIQGQQNKTVFQYSVISALMQGNFDGALSVDQLKEHGNFGLGTFNSLDGEMVVLDGKFYQVTAEGKVNIIQGDKQTPFSIVTNFIGGENKILNMPLSLQELTSTADSMTSANYIYAVKIEGEFSYIKTRSIPAQQKPYKTLAQVTQTQPTFEFENIKGTLIGFKFPAFTEGINVPGYHFHFLSDDKTKGGHLLNVKTTNVTISVIREDNLEIIFPSTEDFKNADLTKKNSEDLKKAEQNKN